MSQQHINREIENNRKRYVSLIRDLVRTSEEGEEALQKLIASKLTSLGCRVETLKLLPIELSHEKEFASKENIARAYFIFWLTNCQNTAFGRPQR